MEYNFRKYIGCDETGVGDYLAPLVSTASYVDEYTKEKINHLNIKDSKKLNDKYIVSIGEELKKKVKHYTIVLSNNKYNKMIQNGYNAHAIKTFLHNLCLCKLFDKYSFSKNTPIVLDKYVSERNYINYLKDIKNCIIPTVMITKAEDLFLAVGISSIIARYSLIKYVNLLSIKYKINFPMGAGKKVDEFSFNFLNHFGIEELKKISKWHFANTNRILKK